MGGPAEGQALHDPAVIGLGFWDEAILFHAQISRIFW